jgi:response regulator RpfG family c-di-GMP phosphodiesterase
MPELPKPKVLLVDDELHLLAGLVRALRAEPLELVTASGGEAALELLRTHGPFAVVVSDLRMPVIDGVALLGRTRALCPDTVRILFTGQLDTEMAVAAVNKGAIFRFIMKPCIRAVMAYALRTGIEQYNLITAQRVLLEQTLHGSIKALTDILALANPLAFGQATRMRQGVSELVFALGVADGWQVEVAAMLSQIGCVSLPPAVLEKVHARASLTSEEEAMVQRAPGVAETVLTNIPRLDGVRDILRYQGKQFDGGGNPPDCICGEEIPWGARALKLLSDADQLECDGVSAAITFDTLRARKGWYDPAILEALAAVRRVHQNSRVRELPLARLRPGMILAEDVRTSNGVLFVARGTEVTPGLQERLHNFWGGFLNADSIRIILGPGTPGDTEIPESQGGVG